MDQATLWAGNLFADSSCILQITPKEIRLIFENGQFERLEVSELICLCTVNASSGQILVAYGNKLNYFRIECNKINFVEEFVFKSEIACLDFYLKGE